MRADRLVAIVLSAAAAACSDPLPPDPFCTNEPLAGDANARTAPAALRVDGTTSVHFLVFDPEGKPVDNQLLGRTVALGPGKYRLKVNESAHTVTVEAGKLVRCATGTLLVSGTTPETWFVHDRAGAALQQDQLGKAIALFPGTFRVRVNNTEATAEVKLNQVTELRTGSLVVEGSGGEQYEVTDKAGASLNHQVLNQALSFFPGEYQVKLGEKSRAAAIEAGRSTSVKFQP